MTLPPALFGIGSLVDIVIEAVKLIPELVLAGCIDVINGAISAFFGIITLVLEEISIFTLPELGTPEFIGEINWFFPLGEVMTYATDLLLAYALFFSVKWVLKKWGII